MVAILASFVSIAALGFVFISISEIWQALVQGKTLRSAVRYLAGERVAQKTFDRDFWMIVNASE